MTKPELKSRFGHETAAVYSKEDPVFLPDYATVFELLVDCVLEPVRPKMSVLDLGAGTGNLSLRLLRRNSGCHVTLVDFSQKMLNEVPKVLAAFKNRYDTKCTDFSSIHFNKDSFDSVISSFSIHHSRSINDYFDLYCKIYKWLKPGGTFACIDVVNGFNKEWTQINENGWINYLSGFFGKDKIEQILGNYHVEDSPISLPDHLFCLNKAGFTQTDILWKRYNFAFYIGKKT